MSEISPAEIAAKFVNLTDKHIFLTGKAGTGKTTFLKNVISLTHKKAVIVAPTGIAAINAAGVTIHSLFQLPFGMFLPRPPAAASVLQHYNTPKTLVKHLNMNAVKRRILMDIELLIIALAALILLGPKELPVVLLTVTLLDVVVVTVNSLPLAAILATSTLDVFEVPSLSTLTN
ncbi:MAG: hypothetical protein EOO42_09580 [Flavobacteriales bacterium]|nr:MAG: hypothetical protein EOO42_09580 [Flavobacteriales bacterium]